MLNFTIRKRILLLALLPSTLLALLLVTFNQYQALGLGQQGVSQFEDIFKNNQQQVIKNYMQLGKKAIEHLYQSPEAVSNPAIRKQALEILRQLRFDDSGSVGYFFVYDRQGVNIMHAANPSLEGRNLMGLVDPNGVEVIRGLWESARDRSGYLYYHWKNPETGETSPKLGYAEELSKWGLMLGTGFWIESLDTQTDMMQKRVDNSLSDSLKRSIITALLVLVVITVLALLVVSSIIQPLRNAVTAMADIADGDGDLTHRLQISGDDELSQLAKAFNRFAQQVNDLVAQVSNSSITLIQSASELDSIIVQSENGAIRQHSESAQIATAITEMAASAQEVARSAMQAFKAAADAEEIVTDSKVTLGSTVGVIDGLAKEVCHGVDVVSELSHESDNIGGVLEVIRSIADQTNLLALNAAIEAARAGDAGRGFAVVADEVRSLAKRTQNSTQEIQKMIQRLQAGISATINLIESLRISSSGSVDKIRQVELALNNISTAVLTINNMNAQIATAAEQQTHVSSAISDNIHQIVIITEATSAGARTAGETSNRLNNIATKLNKLVGSYRV